MSGNDEDTELDADDIGKEENLMFGYGGKDQTPMDLLSNYLPEKNDYGAKTVLTPEQVHLLAALEQITKAYPELEEFDDMIKEWIASYEKRMTSVHGLSRDEFVQILVSMNGGSTDLEESRGILEKVLDADGGNDE